MNIVETVVDLEDRLAKDFSNFQFMPRQTGACLYFVNLIDHIIRVSRG